MEGKMVLEVERKFLCSLTEEEANNLASSSRNIRSIYLKSSEKESIRVVKDTFSHGTVVCRSTIKTSTDSDMVRNEVEEIIFNEIFEALDKGEYPSIEKTRYIIPINGKKWEIDFFKDSNLVIAELEFTSKEEAENFQDFPPWVGKEVTKDSSYLNCNLAKIN